MPTYITYDLNYAGSFVSKKLLNIPIKVHDNYFSLIGRIIGYKT